MDYLSIIDTIKVIIAQNQRGTISDETALWAINNIVNPVGVSASDIEWAIRIAESEHKQNEQVP